MSVRKSPKIQKLVVNAIRKLQDVEGSTPREISNYISQEYDVPSTKIQRQVRLALARAVSYGILQRSKAGYYACNRDFIGCRPPAMEEGQLTEKCGSRRRGRGHGVKRARSRKSRRRKSAAGFKRRSTRRRGGCSSRRRSRRAKSRRRRCGTSGGGKKSRRRRGRRCGASKKSRRRRSRRSRRGRSGKRCAPNSGGGTIGNDDELDVFATRGGRGRARSASATRHENRSISSGSFEEEEQLHDKHDPAQAIDSPETLLD